MATTTNDTADVAYWRDVLLSGGINAIPRWSATPADGVAVHETTLDPSLVSGIAALADRLGATPTSVALAAHARVLASLTGEHDVATALVVDPGGAPRPTRLSTDVASWAELVRAAHDVEAAVVAHPDAPIAELRRELRLTEPSFETVLDPIGGVVEVTGDVVAAVELSLADGALRVRHRADVADADAAARMAGYHAAALGLAVADADAVPGTQSLLSPDELDFLVEGLAGPTVEMPDRRLHELFEDRVRQHPDVIAAALGDTRWTYAELNSRANQIGRELLARGVEAETVVAVVTERNLDWMASVLAIFKAGGVYLPIEPHFPADRIGATLSRAECRLVLTEPESTTTLDEALAGIDGATSVYIGDIYDVGHDDGNLAVTVDAGQVAYIYFTSGSTGLPKGAMCQHDGMINHLYAKVDDLELREGEVVAQIAPQCFDISLWQLVSALLVGGRTVIVDQETILEPDQFVERIVSEQVGVMQVVPSYLEVLLTYLDQNPSALPELHCVSVTGEALTPELARRWFDAVSGIKLANVYGLTETSDDTNHEVMREAPADGVVPLGPAIHNVHVYVVDEHLAPVPLGAPGEIVFSGVCVGRGYINDPDRTAAAYLDDPIQPGERLYRSGDFGRWRPDGKLEFLGRRDAQVKIRGFRIEIGEVENRLNEVPGIRHAAVVVSGSDQAKQLVAFYSGSQLQGDYLRDVLGESLPEYMVPSAFHWQQILPLTDNGKINRKGLTALAEELEATAGPSADHEAPATPTEQRVAEVWASVLDVPPDQISRHDDFFERGGTSLQAVEVVIALERAVSLKEATKHSVLSDLAALIDGASADEGGLLQLLSESGDDGAGTLVCFPYAGGNAVNFQALARSLRGSGVAVRAVELPGHDLTADGGELSALPDVVDQVVAELTSLSVRQVMLWGHSSGAPFAIETARRLEAQGIGVRHVFVAAQLVGTAAARQAHVEQLRSMTNAEITADLKSDRGYTSLGDIDDAHTEHVGAVYRHDCISAHESLLAAMSSPPERVAAPVTVVVAPDDPATVGFEDTWQGWELVAERVELLQLADGGHYFLRTRPDEAAAVVRQVAAAVTVG